MHLRWLPMIVATLEDGHDVLIVLPAADHTHHEWRRAVVAALARAHAPRRINIATGEGAEIDAIESYLRSAAGVTGQYLEANGAVT